MLYFELQIAKLRSRSRSGDGQVRVRKVRVRSESGLKTWLKLKPKQLDLIPYLREVHLLKTQKSF